MKAFLKRNFISLLALFVSVVTIALFWCRIEPYEFDHLVFLCSALGVIVTFLVGFQILNIMDINTKLKAMKELNDVLKSEIQLDRFENYYHLAQFSYNDKNAYRYVYFGLKLIDSRIDYDNNDVCPSMMDMMIQTTKNGLKLTRGEQSELMRLFNKNIKIRLIKNHKVLENRILDAEIVEKSFCEDYL